MKVDCPHCQQVYTLPDGLEQALVCGVCNQVFTVGPRQPVPEPEEFDFSNWLHDKLSEAPATLVAWAGAHFMLVPLLAIGIGLRVSIVLVISLLVVESVVVGTLLFPRELKKFFDALFSKGEESSDNTHSTAVNTGTHVDNTPHERLRFEPLLESFEDAWLAGKVPAINEYLRKYAGPAQAEYLQGLIELELWYVRNRGGSPEKSRYERLFPTRREIVQRAHARHLQTVSKRERSVQPPCLESENDLPLFPGYHVIEKVGEGGQGVVYKVRPLDKLDKTFALKTLQRRDGDVARLVDEARRVAQLRHANIISVVGLNSKHSPPFFVMEYVTGLPLDKACAHYDFREKACVVAKTAEVLHYAHVHGIVHRDVKPDNILVDFHRTPFLTDFGIAVEWDEQAQYLPAGCPPLAGTPQLIPPEVYRLMGDLGPRVDIYALGVTLYRLLTGRYPYHGSDWQEIKRAVLHAQPTLPKDVNPEVPGALQRICLKAMEADPSQRYQTAQELADDLQRFVLGEPVRAQPTLLRSQFDQRMSAVMQNLEDIKVDGMISQAELDPVRKRIEKLIDRDSVERDQVGQFPWETVLLRFGGWLLLLGTLLWLTYWNQLSPFERIVVLGIPMVLMNSVGFVLDRSRNAWLARMFLGAGALLLPVFVAVFLYETNLLRFWRDDGAELFDGWSATYASNFQLFIASFVFAAYCVFLFYRTSAKLFVIWIGLGVWACYLSLLLLAGWKTWEGYAEALLLFQVLTLAFCLAALWLLYSDKPRTANYAYLFFPVPLVIFNTLLAYYGAVEWSGAEHQLDDAQVNAGWIIFGLIYGGIAVINLQAKTSFVRHWGEFFVLLVPVSLLVPANLLFEKAILSSFMVGSAPVTAWELLTGAIATTFVVIGTRLRRWSLTAPGIGGLTVFMFRITERHFANEVSWPFLVAATGAVIVVATVWWTLSQTQGQAASNSGGHEELHQRLLALFKTTISLVEGRGRRRR